jgi:hypothetical protein
MGIEATNVEKVIGELATRESSYITACTDVADTEHAYKMKLAREFVKAEGSVDLRKNLALIECNEVYKEFLTATAVKDYTKEKLKDCQSVLSARQSLLTASVKGDFAYATDRRNT